MANTTDELHAGFTGKPVEKTGSLAEKARVAAADVRHEADTVVAAIADNPRAATTLLITVSAVAFGLGFLMGQAFGPRHRR